MSPVLRRASAGFLRRHPWQLALALLGVALGVAVVVSIDLVRTTARHAFQDALTAATGEATHQILGGSQGVEETLYARLHTALPDLALAPVVETTVGLDTPEGPRRLRLLGVEPFAEAGVRRLWRAGAGSPALQAAALIAEPGTVVASSAAAARLGLGLEQPFSASLGGRTLRLRLLATFEPPGELRGLDDLLLADIATVQEALDRPGRLSRIDLLLPAAGASGLDPQAARAAIEALLPPGHALVETGARGAAALALTDAFYTNLRALALLALLVGMFLIHNTQSFLVVQRRTLLAQLRTLGVTRREVQTLVLGEAATLGAIGGALGLALGVALAEGLLGLVTRTLNDLYFSVDARGVRLDPWVLAGGFVLGLGASVLAAWGPAREAARALPRVGLARIAQEERARAGLGRGALAAVACALLAALLVAAPGGGIVPGFAGLFALMLACALATPSALVALVRLLAPACARLFGLVGRLAAGGVTASLSRTSVAIAALMLAVATTVGMGTMIASFRGAVESWLGTVLRADVYLAGEGGEDSAAPFDESLVARLRALPEVAAVSHVRRLTVEDASGPTQLAAYDLAGPAREGFQWLAGEPAEIWPRFEGEDAVLLTEPLAFRRGLAPGDSLTLPTDAGPRRFEVLGVYRDYGNEQGGVAMSRATFARHFAARGVSGIGVYARAEVGPERLLQSLRAATAEVPGITLMPNARLREVSLAVFDRTFAITEVLRLLAAVIACVGILSALMALQLERTRELGVYRALGFTRAQVGVLLTAQSGLMGLVAGLVALPVGVAIAASLVHVINRRSFGWSMPLDIDPGLLAQGLALSVAAALAAGLYPAWRVARIEPAAALRSE